MEGAYPPPPFSLSAALVGPCAARPRGPAVPESPLGRGVRRARRRLGGGRGILSAPSVQLALLLSQRLHMCLVPSGVLGRLELPLAGRISVSGTNFPWFKYLVHL